MKDKYEHVYIPSPDIFGLSGSDTFAHFTNSNPGKSNLVVVPMEFIHRLSALEDIGSADALKYLKQKLRGSDHINGNSILNVSEGLDITILGSEEKFAPEELEARLRKEFRFSKKKRPVFVTREAKEHIEYAGRGLQVEDPKFLQVSADIVHEGIIVGNDPLLARLRESRNRLDIDEANDLLGRELFLNQFVRFPNQHMNEYARVSGNLIRNRDKTRIIEVDELTLTLLSGSEYGKKLSVGDQVRDKILGISPRDMEQYLALQYGLLNQDISLFFLCGSQGCGKTLLAYVTSVDLILWYDQELRKQRGSPEKEKSFYKQIILLKPNEVLGGKRRDVGALPGTLFDKLSSHLDSYVDAHEESILGESFPFEEMFCHPKYEQNGFKRRSKEASEAKIGDSAYLPPNTQVMKMTYSGFMRGRSF
ncbi:MAG: PhoH family protein, partial [Nanoarchaeota archaeon]|nr:PhoH family protein [Nanoarchaeota archaeon]